MPVASARQELRFLASTVGGGATILGNLSSQVPGGVGAPLSGIRIVVSSETQRLETATRSDGSFSVSGIQAGRLTVRPLLSNALTVVNKSAQALDMREGGCAFLDLTIEVSGGVRGRVLSATGTSLEGMELSLRAVVDSAQLRHCRLARSSSDRTAGQGWVVRVVRRASRPVSPERSRRTNDTGRPEAFSHDLLPWHHRSARGGADCRRHGDSTRLGRFPRRHRVDGPKGTSLRRATCWPSSARNHAWARPVVLTMGTGLGGTMA